MRTRLHLGMTEATPKHVIIILAVGARNIGVLVDAVSDILDVSADRIKPAPTIGTQADATFISGLISLENRMVVLLTVDHLFTTQQIEQAAAEAA
jgi:purine-binding chemotaxis protein CheW